MTRSPRRAPGSPRPAADRAPPVHQPAVASARIQSRSAFAAADGARREAETVFRSQIQRLVADMDFVSREEFEAVRDMARAAREENESLKARLEALEKNQA